MKSNQSTSIIAATEVVALTREQYRDPQARTQRAHDLANTGHFDLGEAELIVSLEARRATGEKLNAPLEAALANYEKILGDLAANEEKIQTAIDAQFESERLKAEVDRTAAEVTRVEGLVTFARALLSKATPEQYFAFEAGGKGREFAGERFMFFATEFSAVSWGLDFLENKLLPFVQAKHAEAKNASESRRG